MDNVPFGGFPVAVIDPPWRYETYSAKGALKHYATMTTEDIAGLPIGDVMAPDSAIFLWVTWPLLTQALDCVTAWGYTYKTCAYDWVKRTRLSNKYHFGQGYYTRANSEPCLLVTRGKTLRRKDMGQSQIIAEETPDEILGIQTAYIEAVAKHSRKPKSIYGRIEKLFDGPYISIFEREQIQGWTCLGNEVTGNDIRDDLKVIIERKCGGAIISPS